MRFRVKFGGWTALSLLFDTGPALELIDDEITGGSSLYTERDPYPPDPAERHNGEYEDRRFGFRC